MPTPTSKSSSQNAGENPSTTPAQELTPDELQQLSALGIDDSLAADLNDVVGIGHAAGPEEHQEEIDRWIKDGGELEPTRSRAL